VSVESEDYIKDGLLYCGKCNTPKQRRLKGEARLTFGDIIGMECSCERKLREEIERKSHLIELEHRREIANADGHVPNKGMFEETFAHDKDPELSKRFRAYVEKFDDMRQKSIGLMLYGQGDKAKSFYAACICNALFDKGYSVVMDSAPNICRRIQDFNEEKNVLSMIRNADMVFLDDVSAESQTGYNIQGLYRLIDERVKARKPLIVTTNLTLAQIQTYARSQTDIEHQRIYSRLTEACVPIESVYSPRTREEIGRDKAEYFKKICGGEV
jgi:DNA replication protein DnaC